MTSTRLLCAFNRPQRAGLILAAFRDTAEKEWLRTRAQLYRYRLQHAIRVHTYIYECARNLRSQVLLTMIWGHLPDTFFKLLAKGTAQG